MSTSPPTWETPPPAPGPEISSSESEGPAATSAVPPSAPVTGSWWQRLSTAGKVGVILVGLFVLGIGVGLAAPPEDQQKDAGAAVVAAPPPVEAPAVPSSDAGTEVISGDPADEGKAWDEEEQQSPAASFEPMTYSGNGAKDLPPIDVPADATLEWENSEEVIPMFLLYDSGFEVSISSEAASGESYVSAGTYALSVAGGDWSFTISPR